MSGSLSGDVRSTKPFPTAGLKAKARELGFAGCGVCESAPPPRLEAYVSWLEKGRHGTMEYLRRHIPLKSDPAKLLPGARSVIAVSMNYNRPNPPRPGYPRIARYALGRDYHKVLRGRLRELAAWIAEAYGECGTRVCVDSAPMMERDFANLAGLGWFGKNTMLIDSRRGSWFFIGLLLTTHAFAVDAPSIGSCGNCRRCVDACPTGAILQDQGRWQVDARRCISYLTIEHRGEIEPALAGSLGGWTFGCDVCQEVCPFNEPRDSQPDRGKPTLVPDFLESREWPTLEELSGLAAERWDQLTRGSAVRRAGNAGLTRNARLNRAGRSR